MRGQWYDGAAGAVVWTCAQRWARFGRYSMYWLTYGITLTNGLQLLIGQQLNWEVSQALSRLYHVCVAGRRNERTSQLPTPKPITVW